MKKINYLLAPFCALSLTATAHALSPKPERCPSAAEIKAVTLNQFDDLGDGYFTVFQINNYGTSDRWVFGINGVQAKSGAKAIKKANKALGSLISGINEPVEYKDGWVCIYANKQHYMSAAFTPVPDMEILKRMKKIG